MQTRAFYWAGAVAVGDYILSARTTARRSGVNGTSRILSFRKDERRAKILFRRCSSCEELGDQRSPLAYSEQTGLIYFTTKGGYLCSAKVDGKAGTLTEAQDMPFGMGEA